MRKLYYGAYEYIETTEPPKNQAFINECGDYGYLMTYTMDSMPAIYFEGVLYRRGKKYREYESVGKTINKMFSNGG